MSKPTLVLAVLLPAFICGLAVGVVIGRMQSEDSLKGDSPPLEGRDQAAPMGRRPRSQAGSAPFSTSQATRKDAVSALPEVPRQSGKGAISGRVLTARGLPLPAVLVAAALNVPGSTTSRWTLSDEESIEEQAYKYSRELLSREAVTYKARTDENGQYVIASLPDGTAPQVASICCHVPFYGPTYRAWTPSDPAIRLLPGTYQLTAHVLEKLCEYSSSNERVEVHAGRSNATVTLRLMSPTGIKGHVSQCGAEELTEVEVYALHCRPQNVPDLSLYLDSNELEDASVDEQLNYEFDELQPGCYLVGVVYPGTRKVAATSLVKVTEGFAVCDFALSPIERRDYLEVWVYGGSGQLLHDVEGMGSHFERRKDGSYMLLEPFDESASSDNAEPSQDVLSVTSKSHGQIRVEFQRTENTTVAVHFQEPAVLEVALSGQPGAGLEGKIAVNVLRVPEDEKEGHERVPRSFGSTAKMSLLDCQGWQVFAPRQPGKYEVLVGVQESERWYAIKRLRVSPHSGHNRLEIEMPSLYSITVMCDDLEAGSTISLNLQSADISVSLTKLVAGGAVTFEHLPAGTYRIAAVGKKHVNSAEVSLPGPSVVRLEGK